VRQVVLEQWEAVQRQEAVQCKEKVKHSNHSACNLGKPVGGSSVARWGKYGICCRSRSAIKPSAAGVRSSVARR